MHKAILFDFDGVLAKTMEDNFNAWRAAFQSVGVDIVSDDYYPLEGMNVVGVAETLIKKYRLLGVSGEALFQKKDEHYFQNNRFELYPGVAELTTKLKKKNIPIAIVTAGRMERLEKTVDSSFLELFNVIITGDKTARGKPYPDPYLLGASKIGYAPKECIVVENAPLGIQAAKAAGAYCIAVASTMRPEHLREADKIVTEFSGIEQVSSIRGLLSGY